MEDQVRERAIGLIEKEMSNGSHGISRGNYEGNELYIVDSWECVDYLQGLINGFEGLSDKPWLKEGESFYSKMIEAIDALKKDPNNWNLKRNKENATKWLMYKQFLAANHIEEITLGDAIDFVFSDEYGLCCHCYTEVVSTSPNCYSWTPPLFLDAEGYVCDNCAHHYKDHILEDYKNGEKAIPHQFCPSDLGLVKVNKDSYQNGWFEGMNDTPKPIIEKLNAGNIDVWFTIENSQFYMEFDAWVKTKDAKKAKVILESVDTYQGYSNAKQLEKALREVKI
jgi:hypothetical protein